MHWRTIHGTPRLLAGFACLFSLIGTLAACSSGTSGAATSGSSEETLTVAVVSAGDATLPLYLPELDGSYAKQHVQVKIIDAGANVLNDLVSGEADLGFVGTGTALAAIGNGLSVSVIYSTYGLGGSSFIVGTSNVKSVSDCTHMIANAPGSANYAWAVYDKKLFNASYSIQSIGDAPTERATLAAGRADCGIGTSFLSGNLISSGAAHIVLDPRDSDELPAGFPTDITEGAIFGLTKDLQSKRAAVVSFLRAYQESLHNTYEKLTPQQLGELAVKSPDLSALGAASIASSTDTVRPFISPDDGQISSAGWSLTPKFFSEGGLQLADLASSKWSYANCVDMSYYNAAMGT